jgi:serine/threonine protein kinase
LDFIYFIYLPMSEEFEEMFDGGDKRNVFSQSFILQKILGKGAFGTVVSAIQRSDQKEVAVKVLFIQCAPSKHILIDLPENSSEQSTIHTFLERGRDSRPANAS